MSELDYVHTTGRIRYVEPTNLFSDKDGNIVAKGAGTLSDAINHPYEDYSMAVDLSVTIANRYSCGLYNYSGEKKELHFSSTNGTLDFFGGTDIGGKQKYLTTNYTDISLTNPTGNTDECLGVESISITYNSWQYPQVVIKFVDVRGATVMLPAENGYYNSERATARLYKALFSFPYPIFMLKVKGFYGKGVTYKLAVEKTSVDFDANSGNFNITVTFVGYMFGIYADLPMTFIGIAPFTDAGDAYWKEHVDNGTFVFRDESGNYQNDMLTIPELREKIATAADSEEYVSAAAEGQELQDNYDKQYESLTGIIDEYPFKEYYEDSEYFVKVLFPDKCTNKSAKEEAIKEYNKIYDFADSLSGYDSTNKTNYVNTLVGVIDSDYFDPEKKTKLKKEAKQDGKSAILLNYIYDIDKHKFDITRESEKEFWEYKEYIENNEKISQYIAIQIQDYKANYSVFMVPKNISSLEDTLIKALNTDRDNIAALKIDSEREYKDKLASIVENIIGFRPSIKNIYDLIFAHVDTFMHCFYDRMKTIKSQLDSNSDDRKKITHSLNDGDTDTPDVGKDSGSIFEYLPPFPAYYKTNDSTKTKETIWPEDWIGLHSYLLEEINYTKEIINGGKLYSEKSEAVEKAIERAKDIIRAQNGATTYFTSSGGDGEDKEKIKKKDTGRTDVGDAPNINIDAFLPLTTYDIVDNKEKFVNPYTNIKRMITNGESSIDGEVLGMFALRAFYYLCVNDEETRKEARTFGTMEAINFYKAVGDDVSDAFVEFVKKYADNDGKASDTKDFIASLKATSSSDNKCSAASTWLFNGNGSNPMFTCHGGNLSFNLNSGKTTEGDELRMYPLFPKGFTSIKDDYATKNVKDLVLTKDYITTQNIQYQSGDTTDSLKTNHPLKGGTFVVFENRDYIYQINEYIEQNLRQADAHFKETRKEYGTREDSEYGKVKRLGRTIRNYQNNITSKFDDKMFKKGVFVDIKESTKEGKEDKIKEISAGRVKKAICEQSYSDRKDLFVLCPIGEQNDKGDVFEKSLFNNPEFLNQPTMEAKAFYFLQNIPLKDDKLEDISENGLVLKANLLKEGSWYWAVQNHADTDKIKFFGKYIEKNIDKLYKAPKNTTPSRVNYLIKYFEYWANNEDGEYGFAGNYNNLINTELYDINDNKRVITRLNVKLSDNSTATISKDARHLQAFLRDILMQVCTTLDYYHGIYDVDNGGKNIISINNKGEMEVKKGDENFVCPQDSMENAFRGFMKELHKIYGKLEKDVTKKDGEKYYQKMKAAESTDPFKSKDLKLSVYMTLKTLYDKWLCSPIDNPYKLWSLDNDESDFQNFLYVDSFYNKIGHKITANISRISEWLSSCIPSTNLSTGEGELLYTGRTVIEFLTEVAQSCGGTLIAMPQKFGLNTTENIRDMFRPIPTAQISKWDEDSSCFVFMYAYKVSEHLGDGETSDRDMNGYKGDGFDILSDDDIKGTSLDNETNAYEIPAFGVTYAKQNQCFFKNITLNTESQGVTEAGLAATFNIAAKGADGTRETTLFGQDLYRVYSNYAYQCSVEMMGNMQVTPMMYFQLNNIPMWKGAYMIKKVSHNITAGNISTSFEGVRLNKYAIPMADGAVMVEKTTGSEASIANNESGSYDSLSVNSDTSGLSSGNAEGEALTNYTGNSNQNTDPIDFNESNVSSTKPIICIVAGHGPNTQKAQEWECMYKVANTIVDKLNNLKYYDGTPYNVQLCNKNGNHTTKTGYNTTQIQQIVKKYGSDCVISVACHWNGGAGKYHGVYLNRLDRGVREDSKVFAKYMQAAFQATKDGIANGSIAPGADYPKGMTDGACNITNLSTDNTDGGPNQNCACVLTENWFADYGCKDGSLSWKTGDRGDYGTGRYWLTSTEGRNIIANAHVNGIKNYIDSLGQKA